MRTGAVAGNVGESPRTWVLTSAADRPPVPPQNPPHKSIQVSDWFTNWRARHWKPRVQQMASEMGGGGGGGGSGGSEDDTE